MPKHRINMVKRKNHRTAVSPAEKNYIKLVEDINSKLKTLNSVEYIKFRDYNTLLLKELGEQFKRKHFKDRSQFSLLKENRVSFFYKQFFIPIDNIKILLKKDNYNYLVKTFVQEGIELIDKMFKTVNSTLVERKYDPIDEKSLYNKEKFNKALEVLEIKSDKKLRFSDIKKVFDDKKEYAGGNMELKNKYNKAFILIREQYADYLTKFSNKNTIEQ